MNVMFGQHRWARPGPAGDEGPSIISLDPRTSAPYSREGAAARHLCDGSFAMRDGS
jgi:hypothetical protein